MEIQDIRLLRGPNYWSNRRHKLVVMRLDLQEMEEKPSDKVDGFYERMVAMLPSLYEHRCSEGHEGGFFERVKDGTWMGHIAEHIALEIQTLAGMDCGFGRTRGTGEKGVYNVVFSYTQQRAGKYAAKACIRIVEHLISGEAYDVAEDIQRLREMREEEKLGPSTSSIVEEAAKRDIPYMRLNEYSLVQLGYGVNQQRIRATITGQTSNIAVDLAGDKEDTKYLLDQAGVPVPKGGIISQESNLAKELRYVGYPCVIKPVDGNHGKGATINVKNEKDAIVAFRAAKEYSRRVIIESFIEGHDFRLLVVNNKLIAAAKREPAHVIGDGKSTLQRLIDEVNEDPRRGYGHENMLTEITVDKMTKQIIEAENLTLESVIEKGRVLYLKTTANLSTGGTSTDVTDSVHPYNVFMAERISRIIGLDICGIDIMASELTTPVNENGGAILEVNAAPGFRMHLDPTDGLPRNVAEPVVDMLFPPGTPARIPIVAVGGTNGKTTTTRLIAHIMKSIGKKVGYTTSDGVYIQNRMLQVGDCTGPQSAQFVLRDPTVDYAVLETARGGILRAGLGFSYCDVGIVTNVSADHIGLKGIQNIEQLAKVKAVVVENVHEDGYAILNADDDLVYKMKDDVKSKIAYFSMDPNNPRIKTHCNAGGIAAIYENDYVTICKGEWKMRVDKVGNIPLTFGGRAEFMIKNVMPAALAAFLQGVKMEDIRLALQTFNPSPAQTPGRMNIFQFTEFTVLLDYAHNPAGMDAVGDFLRKTKATTKVGILAGTGDRRDEDIKDLGRLAAEIFDEVIVRRDPQTRGRSEQEIFDFVVAGIHEKNPNMPLTFFPDEETSIRHAIANAKPGSFITVLGDDLPMCLSVIGALKDKDNKESNVRNSAIEAQ